MVNLNLDRLALGIVVQPVCSTTPGTGHHPLSLSLKGQHLQPSSGLSLLLPNGPGSVEIPERAQTISFSCTKGRVPVCSLIPQGHYQSLLLDYDSGNTCSCYHFIYSVSLLCVFFLNYFYVSFFAFFAIRPHFSFHLTFSCKRFSSASAFIWHYVTSGNFNICLEKDSFLEISLGKKTQVEE